MTDTLSTSIEAQYALAETTYNNYFEQKDSASVNREQLYQMLMDCLKGYLNCVENADDTRLSNIKERLRCLRPEFEIAGIVYSSNGNNKIAYKFLECYLNIPELPVFAGEKFPRSEQYPAYVFIVAAESHNSHDYESAVSYLRKYIELGEKKNQQICYEFLAADLDLLERFDEEMSALDEGIMNYPHSMKMLKRAISLYTQIHNNEKVKEMFDKAIAMAPNDSELQRFKADIDYQNDRFAEALPIYSEIYKQNPNDPNRTKKLALCHFNLAGSMINESNNISNPKELTELRSKAIEHFNQAITLLEPLSKNVEVVRGDPSVFQALSDALTQVGRSSEADIIRQQVSRNTDLLANAERNPVKITPNFNDWGKERLDRILSEWERRGEFEPAEDYMKRVNPETRNELIAQTKSSLEQDYIREFSDTYNLDDLTIKPYDPDHETYCIKTQQGDIYIKVPIEGNQAKNFKDNWNGIKIKSPQFKVNSSGKLLLAKAVFATPDGQSYTYDANEELTYKKIKIAKPEWNDNDFFLASNTTDTPEKAEKQNDEDEPINVGDSDVDIKVPKTNKENENTFALIIANENYTDVEGVRFARNDGESFKRYCMDVLGVLDNHIVSALDATYGNMRSAIRRIKDFEQVYKDMKLLVYYSGHGQPDPSSKEAYLLPVDASPSDMSSSYKLSEFYQDLIECSPSSVTVFLDACFSGSNKEGKIMDKNARGVIIVPKDETPANNMVIFSACSGDQTAYPYENQKHGLFTYYLLKKLQEDKGKTNYKQLADYIEKNVKQKSLNLPFKKLQTPTIQTNLPEDEWGNWRLVK